MLHRTAAPSSSANRRRRRVATGHRARAYATTDAPPPIALSAAQLAGELLQVGQLAAGRFHIGPVAHAVLLALAGLARPGAPLVVPLAVICAEVGRARSTVSRAIGELEHAGFLRAIERCVLVPWPDGRPGRQRRQAASAYELRVPDRSDFARPVPRGTCCVPILATQSSKEEIQCLTALQAAAVRELQALLGTGPRWPEAGGPLAGRMAAVEAARAADWAARHRLE